MNQFDQLLNKIQNGTPDAAAQAEAAARVREQLFGPGAAGAGQIRGCDDFRGLIPAYLQRTLSEPRRMLLEDHTKECVACRKAIAEARGGGRVVPMPAALSGTPTPKWAIAAALIVGLGTTAVAARYSLPGLFDSSPRASVATVDGILYRVSNSGSLPIGEATDLADGEEVRTPAGSRAVIRLWDGSRVEMNERAEISVSRGWRGTTVHLERGHVIIQAARQKQGKLYVATGDSQVAVIGTIFSVNRGTHGSRISVVEGQVEVQHNGRTDNLKPGGQATTSEALGKVPVEAEIAWSRDAARYVALLGELNALQKSLEALPPTGLRYQSRLLIYLPEDTQMFASVPNMGVTLTEAKRIFDERLRDSEVLRQWWEAAENKGMRTGVEYLLDRLRELSAYIGDEVIFAVLAGNHPSALVMAEVRSPAIKDVLDRLIQEAGAGKLPFVYSIQNNVLLIAENQARLAAAQAAVARGGSPATPFRQRIEQTYRSGAGWIMCANLEQIIAGNVLRKQDPTAASLGLNTVQHLMLERRDIAGKTENRASVTFTGPRTGIPAWLASPGPMSSLNFVSPDAGGAVSVVVKQPRALLDELFQTLRKSNSNFDFDIAKFEQFSGIRVLDDLAAPLGTEATFAMDGPLLPVPGWKVVLEVNAPQRLQTTIEKLVEMHNKMNASAPRLVLTSEQANQRTFYKLTGSRLPTEVHYAFIDSYLVMAPSRTLITQAIQHRETGNNLPRSERFRSQLPYATNPNFSAVVYHNLGGMFGPMVDVLQGAVNVTPAQRQSMQAVKTAQPGVIGAYGESDRITIASNGNLLGLNLGMFAGLDKGGIFQALQPPGK